MTQEVHNEVMNNVMKQLDRSDLDLGDGVAIWHSLGLFLFSKVENDTKDLSKIYSSMKEYLNEIEALKTQQQKG
jgi:hypothetical protein